MCWRSMRVLRNAPSAWLRAIAISQVIGRDFAAE
jgi:hypothetical protein